MLQVGKTIHLNIFPMLHGRMSSTRLCWGRCFYCQYTTQRNFNRLFSPCAQVYRCFQLAAGIITASSPTPQLTKPTTDDTTTLLSKQKAKNNQSTTQPPYFPNKKPRIINQQHNHRTRQRQRTTTTITRNNPAITPTTKTNFPLFVHLNVIVLPFSLPLISFTT